MTVPGKTLFHSDEKLFADEPENSNIFQLKHLSDSISKSNDSLKRNLIENLSRHADKQNILEILKDSASIKSGLPLKDFTKLTYPKDSLYKLTDLRIAVFMYGINAHNTQSILQKNAALRIKMITYPLMIMLFYIIGAFYGICVGHLRHLVPFLVLFFGAGVYPILFPIFLIDKKVASGLFSPLQGQLVSLSILFFICIGLYLIAIRRIRKLRSSVI